MVVDRQGIIIFANPASAQMFNKSLHNLVGQELGLLSVGPKISQIEIIRANGELGVAQITVAEAEWDEQPVSVVCLRDIGD